MDSLHDDALNLAQRASLRASVCKTIHNLINIYIIVSAAVISALGFVTAGTIKNNNTGTSAGENNDVVMSYVISILGIFTALVKSLDIYFGIGKRAISYKGNSVRLKRIARAVTMIKCSGKMTTAEKLEKLDLLYADIDEIELNVFTGEQDTLAMASIPETSVKQSNVEV
jgi:hypothetical protein